MFEFAGKGSGESKCYLSHGVIGHLDPKQPPVKRKPYASILAVPFIHKVDLVLPEELYELIKGRFDTILRAPVYSRVILPLSALLEDDFFNEYIKKGNISMLSEGERGMDNVYSLKDGLLTLSLDKENYERAGLVGKPDGAKGKRGTRARWIVEINLRLPSMLQGKKAFNRIVYAFKNALTNLVTWLFTDFSSEAPDPDLLEKHFPVRVQCQPRISSSIQVLMPHLSIPPPSRTPDGDDVADHAVDLYEWLSLIILESPRVSVHDKIDPFLSRYAVGDSNSRPENAALVKITWEGFLSPQWAHKVFVQSITAAASHMWFAFAVSGFDGSPLSGSKDTMILKLPCVGNDYISWEVDQN